MTRTALRLLDRWWPGHPTTAAGWWGRILPALMNVIRLTVGAVLAYVATGLLTDGPVDLTGTLTALLVMQASVTGSARMGLVRVGAVLTGITVALAVSIFVGLSWWSLGLVIFSSLVIARILRLGDQILEAPISAMLILAASAQPIAAEYRLLNTAVGTLIGIGLPLLWPPAIPIPAAGAAVRRVAGGLAAALTTAGEYVDEHTITRAGIQEQLDNVRSVTGDIGRASDRVAAVRDRWRWNSRAIGRADITVLLQTGLESLQAAAMASRTLFGVMLREAPEHDTPDDGFGSEVRAVFAVVLHDLGSCLDSYGRLLEAETRGDVDKVENLAKQNRFLVGETRAILTELMMVGPDQERLWVLRGSILKAVDEILWAIDPVQRAAFREQWQSEQGDRPLPDRLTTSELPTALDRATLAALWPFAASPDSPAEIEEPAEPPAAGKKTRKSNAADASKQTPPAKPSQRKPKKK